MEKITPGQKKEKFMAQLDVTMESLEILGEVLERNAGAEEQVCRPYLVRN